jgi:hypothetical protein
LKKQQEEIMERERMRLLLEDNEEAYRALLKEKKDNRLEYLLTRTDNYVCFCSNFIIINLHWQKFILIILKIFIIVTKNNFIINI